MSFTPSAQQANAIAAIVDWYRHRRGQQQVFRLFGYAGTGKSTITAAAIDALGLDPMARDDDGDGLGGVLFAAFTGKAALVMTRKGTPASTIHSLIYRVSEATPEEIARVEKELFDLQRDLLRMAPAERVFAEIQIRRLELRLADIYRPTFLLNEQSRVRDADLVVLDEVSMVGAEMATDLLAFGKPILVLGDPGQLPPIKGAGAFTEAPPDVMLTEIHRQAGESAIIRLATMARQGIEIPAGGHDEHVWKLPRNAVGPAQMLRGGQVICGRNNTRLWLNAAMKDAAGFPAVSPAGQSEKIICLKNRHDLGLVNGMFVTLSDIEDEGRLAFRATVTTEDGLAISGRHRFYKGHYDDHVQRDPDRERRDWRELRGLIETSWGYAITCHKSQGSQWENVIVYDDRLSRTPEDRARWLYTAITRAERGLVILD
jgi:exodeoxyribonuclease-5